MRFFNRKKKQESQDDINGKFLSFVLLNDVSIDLNLLVRNILEEWNIVIPSEDINEKGAIISEIDGVTATVALIPEPVPNGASAKDAKTNFRWPNAVSVAEAHKAFIAITVSPKDATLLSAAELHVKLCACCLKQSNATAIHTLGRVFAPDFYIEGATFIKNGDFPIFNLIFFGVYSDDNGKTFCGYTDGMFQFGKKELKISNSSHSADEISEFLVDIALYVIERDVTLKVGETFGPSEEEQFLITESMESNDVTIDGNTLKIQY